MLTPVLILLAGLVIACMATSGPAPRSETDRLEERSRMYRDRQR